MVTSVNLYCPNSGEVPILKEVLLQLTSFQAGLLIFGGDFNIALDPLLDTSNGASSLPFSALRQVKLRLASLTGHLAHNKPTGERLHILLSFA